MSSENTESSKKKKGGVFTFILGLMSVLILFVTLAGMTYYYLFLRERPIVEDVVLSFSPPQVTQEVKKLTEQIKRKDGEIKILKEENAMLKEQTQGITQRLKYVIKPKAQLIAECYSVKNGQWKLPQDCLKTAKQSLSHLLKSDQKVVAIEVIGIVDEKKYRGRSPELKQEGLASFRAKQIIKQMQNIFPSVVFFEGLSQEMKQKRGFAIRAYYIE